MYTNIVFRHTAAMFCSQRLNVYFLFPLTAGYNNVEVAQFLLDQGADVNARDKGGLIPLHNASSYGVGYLSFVIKFLIYSAL